ncbi:MAG: dipicolinate synthase subunit DpsA [Lachnospiraceae bacterium]
MKKTEIGIFCGDRRHVYLAKLFLQKGYPVTVYRLPETMQGDGCITALSLEELTQRCPLLIGPIPFTNDSKQTVLSLPGLLNSSHFLVGGIIPPELTDLCEDRKIPYYDLMKNEKIAILNSVATAEGSIMEAILTSDKNLHGSSCLVMGYGRCARTLAEKLKGLDAIVTVAARSEAALAFAQASGFRGIPLSDKDGLADFDFIFNTIPALVLDQDRLALLKQEAVIIDISSAPGGIDYGYAKQRGLKAKLCSGLPGKISPKSSADILADEIILLMRKEKFHES